MIPLSVVWLQYAAFEEIDTKDYDRARDVYKAAVKLVPHRSFTFAKMWLAYANFEIRQLDVSAARKVLGAGIGICPKPKLFSGYIELEMRLREFDRVRMLYEKFLAVSTPHRRPGWIFDALQYDPSLSSAWIQWTQVESAVEDFERVRAIYELAVRQALDMPEVVWKVSMPRHMLRIRLTLQRHTSILRLVRVSESGLDIFMSVSSSGRPTSRYDTSRLCLLALTHQVYISYALMEMSTLGGGEDEDGNEIEGDSGDSDLARAVFERGYKDLRNKGEKEEVSDSI